MSRDAFPVDTHVHRVSSRLGLVGKLSAVGPPSPERAPPRRSPIWVGAPRTPGASPASSRPARRQRRQRPAGPSREKTQPAQSLDPRLQGGAWQDPGEHVSKQQHEGQTGDEGQHVGMHPEFDDDQIAPRHCDGVLKTHSGEKVARPAPARSWVAVVIPSSPSLVAALKDPRHGVGLGRERPDAEDATPTRSSSKESG